MKLYHREPDPSAFSVCSLANMPHTPWSWGRDLFLGMTFTYISTLVAYSRTKLVSPSNYNEAADERANELCQPCDENHKYVSCELLRI